MQLDRHVHAGARVGELQAFDRAARGAPAMWERILAELELAGDAGLTPDEFAQSHRALINTVRRRFTDLWKAGKIKRHPRGLHRQNADGNLCVVWVLGYDAEGVAQRRVPRASTRPLPENRIMAAAPPGLTPIEAVGFARAVEAAHGIC